MLCVYSVNICGVSRWVAVLIGLPFKCPWEYYGVVSGTGGFMRLTQQIHRCVDPSSKRLEKRDKGRQSEKNVKSVKPYDKNVPLFITWNYL